MGRTLMRFSEFFNRTSKPKVTQKVISVVNEVREQALLSKMAVLETEVDRLQSAEASRDEFHKRMDVAEERFRESINNINKLEHEKKLLGEQVKDGDLIRIQKVDVVSQLRAVTAELGKQGSTLEQAQHNNVALNATIVNLTDKVETGTVENGNLNQRLEYVTQKELTNSHKLHEFQQQFEEISKNFQTTQVKYKEIMNTNSELSQTSIYWKSLATSLEDEKQHLEVSRQMLQEFSSTLEVTTTEQKGVAKIKQVELTKLKEMVKTMTEQTEQLIAENTYLAGLSSELKAELSRPKYMSMSAIERSEGFKMPMGGSREHYLGHGKPTLLKFKTGGSANVN